MGVTPEKVLDGLKTLEEGDFPFLRRADELDASQDEEWRVRIEVEGIAQEHPLEVFLSLSAQDSRSVSERVLRWVLPDPLTPEPTRHLALSILAAHAPMTPARTMVESVPAGVGSNVTHEIVLPLSGEPDRGFETSEFQGLALRWVWCSMALFRFYSHVYDRSFPQSEATSLRNRINEKLRPLMETSPGAWASRFKPPEPQVLGDLLNGIVDIPALAHYRDLLGSSADHRWPRKRVKGPDGREWTLLMEPGDAPFVARLVISPLVTVSSAEGETDLRMLASGETDELLLALVGSDTWGRFGRARYEFRNGERRYQGVSEVILPPENGANLGDYPALFRESLQELLRVAFSACLTQARHSLQQASGALDEEVDSLIAPLQEETERLLGSD